MANKSGSKFSTLLIVSVVVNALLIGFIIGGGLGQRRGGSSLSADARGPNNELRMASGIERVLAPEERSTVRRALRQAFRDTRQERRTIGEARRNLETLLSADPYDTEAVETALESIRTAEANAKARLHEELNAQIAKLSPEQRAEMVKMMQERRPLSRGPERVGPRRPDAPR